MVILSWKTSFTQSVALERSTIIIGWELFELCEYSELLVRKGNDAGGRTLACPTLTLEG